MLRRPHRQRQAHVQLSKMRFAIHCRGAISQGSVLCVFNHFVWSANSKLFGGVKVVVAGAYGIERGHNIQGI